MIVTVCRRNCAHSDLREDLRRGFWLSVEEVQHVARVLDAVFSCLFWGGEPVVPGAMEFLEAACAIFQLVALTRNDGLLLGYAAGNRRGEGDQPFKIIYGSYYLSLQNSAASEVQA